MNRNGREILRDHLIEKKQEEMREKAVTEILSDSSKFFHDINFNFKIVLSPKSYPIYNESLDFDFQDFSDFFFDITIGTNGFDSEGFSLKTRNFIQPMTLNEWMNISEHRRFPNSIIIKKDGVIMFNHAQTIEEAHTIIDFNIISKHLTLFITEIVPKIYEKMNYAEKIKMLVEYGDLSRYQLIYGNPSLKYDFSPHYKPSKNLILHLENPESVLRRITTDFQKMFFKLHEDP